MPESAIDHAQAAGDAERGGPPGVAARQPRLGERTRPTPCCAGWSGSRPTSLIEQLPGDRRARGADVRLDRSTGRHGALGRRRRSDPRRPRCCPTAAPWRACWPTCGHCCVATGSTAMRRDAEHRPGGPRPRRARSARRCSTPRASLICSNGDPDRADAAVRPGRGRGRSESALDRPSRSSSPSAASRRSNATTGARPPCSPARRWR